MFEAMNIFEGHRIFQKSFSFTDSNEYESKHESERLFGVSKNIHFSDKFFRLDVLIFFGGRQKQIGKFQSSHV